MGGALLVVLDRVDVLSFDVVQVLQNVLKSGSLLRGVLGAGIDQFSEMLGLGAKLLEVVLGVGGALLG